LGTKAFKKADRGIADRGTAINQFNAQIEQ